MKLDIFRKVVGLEQLAGLGRRYRDAGKTVALCHGCFDIVHPGHLRYLQFAKSQAEVLVVSVTGDDAIEKDDGQRPLIPQELRAENLAALEYVDHVVIADGPTAEPVIAALRPDLYIKGKEYEQSRHPGFVAEKRCVERYGGRVMFSSGNVVYSSTALVERMAPALAGQGWGPGDRLAACCARWDISAGSMRRLLDGMADRRVVVVGDTVCDRYIFCDATDVAGEAPVLSVRPLRQVDYAGAAAVMAQHAAGLGAAVHLVTAVADDPDSRQVLDRLEQWGVETTAFVVHKHLPVKVRYLVESQKLLKVDQAEPRPLDSTTQRQVLGRLAELRRWADVVLFADFGYGAVTPTLVEQAGALLRPSVGWLGGDVSGPRRTLLSMKHFDLLTPTEREMRSVLGDFERSLPGAAIGLMRQLRCPNLAVTLGARGCVLFRPRHEQPQRWFSARLRSEYLPSLAGHAIDPVGAGDAFLPAAAMALAGGGSLVQAGYLASLVSAVAVGRLGNEPVDRPEVLERLACRAELQTAVKRIGAG